MEGSGVCVKWGWYIYEERGNGACVYVCGEGRCMCGEEGRCVCGKGEGICVGGGGKMYVCGEEGRCVRGKGEGVRVWEEGETMYMYGIEGMVSCVGKGWRGYERDEDLRNGPKGPPTTLTRVPV